LQDENDNNSDLNEEEKDSIVFSQKTSVKKVIYSTIPIKYPKTSEVGVAIVFNVTDPRACWNNIKELFNLILLVVLLGL
jgi:hypothetical protein